MDKSSSSSLQKLKKHLSLPGASLKHFYRLTAAGLVLESRYNHLQNFTQKMKKSTTKMRNQMMKISAGILTVEMRPEEWDFSQIGTHQNHLLHIASRGRHKVSLGKMNRPKDRRDM